MVRSLFVLRLALTVTLVGLGSLTATTLAGEPEKLGRDLTEAPRVRIAELLADPEAWVGKTVQVEGRITDVCPKRGCWVDIQDNAGSIRLKVRDYEIFFETSTKGHHIVAEGIFRRVEPGDAHAEEESATASYRLDGVGAEVQPQESQE